MCRKPAYPPSPPHRSVSRADAREGASASLAARPRAQLRGPDSPLLLSQTRSQRRGWQTLSFPASHSGRLPCPPALAVERHGSGPSERQGSRPRYLRPPGLPSAVPPAQPATARPVPAALHLTWGLRALAFGRWRPVLGHVWGADAGRWGRRSGWSTVCISPHVCGSAAAAR